MSLLNPLTNFDDQMALNRIVTSLGLVAGGAFALAFPLVMAVRVLTGNDPGFGASFLAAAISLIGSMMLLVCLKARDRELDAVAIAAGADRLRSDLEVLGNLNDLLRGQGNRLALSQLRELEEWREVRRVLNERDRGDHPVASRKGFSRPIPVPE